jgi:hypothetical protein
MKMLNFYNCREPTSWMARFFNLNVPIVASRTAQCPHVTSTTC